MAEPLRHRQTKAAETDMFYLTPPRHISTLPLELVAYRVAVRLAPSRTGIPAKRLNVSSVSRAVDLGGADSRALTARADVRLFSRRRRGREHPHVFRKTKPSVAQ